MKNFRTIILIFFFVIGGIFLTNCGGGNRNPIHQNANEQLIQHAPDNPNRYTEKKQILDTINSSESQHETLKEGEGKNTIYHNVASNERDGKNGTNNLFGIISCVIAIMALFMALYVYLKLNYLSERIDRHRNEINSLNFRIREFESHGNSSNPAYNRDYASLDSRIRNLENQVEKNSHNNTTEHLNVDTKTDYDVRKYHNEQNGYFGNPINATEPYFKKMLVSHDSEARFYANISGKSAIFKPLDSSSYLGTFVSNDAMRAAIDFKGCAPSEASSMQVIISGEAEQRDNKWVIIKKATVLLS